MELLLVLLLGRRGLDGREGGEGIRRRRFATVASPSSCSSIAKRLVKEGILDHSGVDTDTDVEGGGRRGGPHAPPAVLMMHHGLRRRPHVLLLLMMRGRGREGRGWLRLHDLLGVTMMMVVVPSMNGMLPSAATLLKEQRGRGVLRWRCQSLAQCRHPLAIPRDIY